MSTTATYDHILSTMPRGLEKDILALLHHHIGKDRPIKREALSLYCFDAFTTTTDRQVREAIETLRREYRVPVLSESGKAGYWLAADQSEIDTFIAEMQARRDNIDQVIGSMRSARVAASYKMPNSQMGLW